MTNHTTGPWTENACEVQAPDGSAICEMLSRPEDSGVNYPYAPEADANSRLICAAPDLLAAANRIIEGLANGGELEGLPSGTPVSVPIDDICALVQAVEKAKGGVK